MLKKTFIAACCSVAICLVVTLWVVPTIKATETTPAPASESALPLYMAGEYEGHVAFYRYGEIKPFEILESKVEKLTDADRAMLQEGIPIASEEALRELREDYSE